MRLIDADELKKALAKNITIWTFNVSYDGILAEIIDNAPTVAPSFNLDNITEEEIKKFRIILQRANSKGLLVINEERPQGEWKRHDEWRNGEYIGGFYHVNCPCEDGLFVKWQMNYCGNCGAPMQLEEEEEGGAK